MSALGRARIRVASIRAQPGRVRLLVSSRMAARAKRILSEKPSLPTPELGEPLSILCFVGEGIGEDSSIRDQIESFAIESDIQLQFSDEEPRDHAIHATVPANQTEQSIQSLCTALDLLTQ